jgi:hypothetical protein
MNVKWKPSFEYQCFGSFVFSDFTKIQNIARNLKIADRIDQEIAMIPDTLKVQLIAYAPRLALPAICKLFSFYLNSLEENFNSEIVH